MRAEDMSAGEALVVIGLIALLIFLAIVRGMFPVEVEEPEENSDAEGQGSEEEGCIEVRGEGEGGQPDVRSGLLRSSNQAEHRAHPKREEIER